MPGKAEGGAVPPACQAFASAAFVGCYGASFAGRRSFAPPSVLPDISPTRGEIGSHGDLRQNRSRRPRVCVAAPRLGALRPSRRPCAHRAPRAVPRAGAGLGEPRGTRRKHASHHPRHACRLRLLARRRLRAFGAGRLPGPAAPRGSPRP
ncbi:hypothetical protein EN766_29670, partial [Mesorhizobium sp. M2A.F.Ca.ET.046.02.1.1]